MAYPPLDPFAGYLEVVSVIGILELKRALLLGSEGGDLSEDGESRILLARIEDGLLEALELKAVYEERIEDVLQNAADRADALRVLFDSISERMAQMQVWIEDAIHGLPEEDREEWDLLVSDYERIREQLGENMPPGEEGSDSM
jgi:hypothetical protein